nr:radical SAM protein [Clostridioides difficile]
MEYDMPLYRPPSEAYSLIIQVTLGCSHNKCTFCSMYKSKKFKIKPLEVIKNEIDIFRRHYKNADRIFLADGDALIIPMEKLRDIILYIKEVFPECERITLYGSPKSIEKKTDDELKELKKLGVKMIYLGLESGNDEVLEDIKKGFNSEQLIKVGRKVKKNGIKLSATVIAGLGGTKKTHQHGVDTGKMLGAISPDYVGVLSLMVEPNTELYDLLQSGEFTVLEDKAVLQEIKEMIKNIDTNEKVVFRSNHASNYVNLKGILPEDKQRLIDEIDYYLSNLKLKREEYRRL